VQNTQADLAAGQIALMVVQLQLDEKISADEVDPTLIELNTKLADARKRMEEAKKAGEESWKTLESGASEAFNKLGQSINQAFDRLKKK
jgi:hypothetical protein